MGGELFEVRGAAYAFAGDASSVRRMRKADGAGALSWPRGGSGRVEGDGGTPSSAMAWRCRGRDVLSLSRAKKSFPSRGTV